MKIVHLVAPDPVHGLEGSLSSASSMTGDLARAGVETGLHVPRGAPGGLLGLLGPRGGEILATASLVRDRKAAAFHCHGGLPGPALARFLARAAGAPWILSLGRGSARSTPGARESSKRPATLTPRYVLVRTKTDQRIAERRFPRSVVEYLPDPVEADSLPRGDGLAFRHVHGIPQQNPLVLIVGPVGPMPHSSTILDVLTDILALHPRNVVAFVGAEREDSLRRVLGRRHDRQHRLRVLPPFPRSGLGLRDAANAADLVVLTPDCPDADRAIVEAWCGLHPVIAPRWGEPGLLVRDGVDGLLYDPRDPAELLAAIGSIFRDPHGASSITRKGFTRILEEFEGAAVLRRLCQIYARCIEDYESGPGRLRAW